MNPRADHLGIVTLLRGLREQGLVSGSEAKKIAARLTRGMSARTSRFLSDFFAFGYGYLRMLQWYCVLLNRG